MHHVSARKRRGRLSTIRLLSRCPGKWDMQTLRGDRSCFFNQFLKSDKPSKQHKICHFLTKKFPCGSAGKEFACNAGDLGLIPGLGRFLREGKGYTLQYSGLENFIDCTVHEATKESEMTEQFSSSLSSIIVWKIP